MWWSGVRAGIQKGVFTAAAAAAICLAARPLAAQSGDGAAVSIHIWKARRQLELLEGEVVVRSFPVALGLDPHSAKRTRGDYRTPEGNYYITEKNGTSRFRRFLGLSYPNIEDADRGYVDRLIDASQWTSIFLANVRGMPTPWSTILGGRVGIHGRGGRDFGGADWTEGCIALSDDDIDYVYDQVSVGTPVSIGE